MEQPTESKDPSKISQWEAAEFVWELLLIVAVPTTLAALGGRWVDRAYGTTPWATLLGLLLALSIVGLLVVRRAKVMANRMKS